MDVGVATRSVPAHRRWLISARAWTPGYAALAIPALVLLGGLVVYPMVEIARDSLQDGGAAYSELASSRTFRASLRATIELSAITTVCCLVLGYPVAFLAAQLGRRRARWLLLGVVLCFWISILVRTYAWTVILGRNGLLNDLLTGVGIVGEPQEFLFTRFAVVVGMTHYLLPFMILTLYAGLSGIDRQLVSAARTLGASAGQSFRRVYLPLSAPAIFAACTIVFVIGVGFFLTPALLGGPKDATIAVFIERQLFFLRFDAAAAAAIVLTVFVAVLFAVADRLVGLDRLFTTTRGRL
jgi:putative spermidine/putrescine transport system permease protein